MFRFIFAFLLLNSSYRSLGVPIVTNGPANLLTALGTTCENTFLSEQIKNKIEYCTELASPHGEKQLECLIFYDINKQLCAAVGASKLALTEDYSAKINEDQDVTQLCGRTEDWVFSNLTGFPLYKHTVDKVFKHPIICGKICGVEDLMSDNANYFCRYLKWGNEMLKNQVSVIPTKSNSSKQPINSGSVESKPVVSAVVSDNDLADVQIKTATSEPTANVAAAEQEAPVKNEDALRSPTKSEATSENNQAPEQASADSTPVKTDVKDKVDDPISAVDSPPTNDQELSGISNPEGKDGENKLELDAAQTKPGAEESLKNVDKEIQSLNTELEHKESALEPSKDKLPSDSDDYQDADEGKEGLGDIQGEDDGEDPAMDEIDKNSKVSDQKVVDLQPPEHLKSVESGFTGESVPGLFPSFGQENYDDDDSDHFFSFFLTAVIMVVLIYVLYHNKNRVGKVFFGLLVEGRQSGRRRNSRGHAYRRLDTLEQAMSTNTAAPPSKIIY